MKPTHVCDTNDDLLFLKKKFDLVVWDPPHMNCGPNSNMARLYGHWSNEQIRNTLSKTQERVWHVTKENALMALKWNNHDIKLEKVFELLTLWEPLFGHMYKNGPHSQSFWVQLLRRPRSE
jgi:hypothetical protein